jgi:hypothetical protein
MTKRERDVLAIRFIEIESELGAIVEGRVVDDDPADVIGRLLQGPALVRYSPK